MKQPAIKIENYEDCLYGKAQTYKGVLYAYDKDKIIEKIMRVSNCDEMEAIGFFNKHININYGPTGPIFVQKIKNCVTIDI